MDNKKEMRPVSVFQKDIGRQTNYFENVFKREVI